MSLKNETLLYYHILLYYSLYYTYFIHHCKYLKWYGKSISKQSIVKKNEHIYVHLQIKHHFSR